MFRLFNNRIVLFWAAALLVVLGHASVTQAATNPYKSCDSPLDGLSNAQLEDLLKKCEAEIAAQRVELSKIQTQAAGIEQGIGTLTQKIKTTEAQIKQRTAKIVQLLSAISSKNKRITELETTIATRRESIAELFRKMNEYDEMSPIEVMLSSKGVAELVSEFDSYETLKEDLYMNLLEMKDLKNLTETERKALEANQKQEQMEKFNQEKEKEKTAAYKAEQQRILTTTRGQEAAYQKDLAAKIQKQNEIKSRMLKTVGGTEIRFDEALKLIRPYESSIGVDAALTLAVLTQESSVNGIIGSNIGKCTYNQAYNNESGTVMSATQKPYFETIMAELGIDADQQVISCPIPQDGQYGGAMGPSQFMPLTWAGFKDRIASVLGISAPSPFNNLHAFTGTSLYLADAQTRCKTAFTSQHDIWACSAAKYYSGLGSTGPRLSQHMTPTWSYGYRVATRAAQFKADIATLDL